MIYYYLNITLKKCKKDLKNETIIIFSMIWIEAESPLSEPKGSEYNTDGANKLTYMQQKSSPIHG